MTWVTFIATEKNTNGSIYENTILVTLLEAPTIENKGFTTSKNASIDGNYPCQPCF